MHGQNNIKSNLTSTLYETHTTYVDYTVLRHSMTHMNNLRQSCPSFAFVLRLDGNSCSDPVTN